MASNPYETSINMAIKAIENVQEPYKLQAFSVILAHLLNGQSRATPPEQSRVPQVKTQVRPDTGDARPGPKSWIRELIAEGSFEKPKSSKEILLALNERGHILKPQDITKPLADLVSEKLLRRSQMKSETGKDLMHWVNR
jgi:hypothetical protein